MIFYHNADLDGHCSGAICKIFMPNEALYGFNYGYKVPWELIKDELDCGGSIYLVDISFSVPDMLKLKELAGDRMVWIDHHELPVELRGLPAKHEIGVAACELCWEYFSKRPCPLPVRLLGAYDVWKFELFHNKRYGKDDILSFQYGVRSTETNPEDHLDFWEGLIYGEADLNEIFYIGETILKYQNSINRRLKYSLTTFAGYKAMIINSQGINSLAFEELAVKDAIDLSDMLMVAYYEKDGWAYYSLYTQSESINCAEIARENGGGGHKQAAGFKMKLRVNIYD